jgi:hypothetical protein
MVVTVDVEVKLGMRVTVVVDVGVTVETGLVFGPQLARTRHAAATSPKKMAPRLGLVFIAFSLVY